jgi:osmotically-inducible protein OsmY
MDRGDLVMEGEVEDVAAKKLALERAAAIPGVDRIIDRLHVRPARRMEDGEVRQHVCNALIGEPALRHEPDSDAELLEALRVVLEKDPIVEPGSIQVSVRGRVVTLTGAVASDEQRHMAEMDAWFVWGVDRVVNQLRVLH